MDEVKGRACGNGLLADDAIGKYAQILHCFPEVKDNALCCWYVLRDEDGDMRLGWVSVERKATGLKPSLAESTTELAANTCYLVLGEASTNVARFWRDLLFIASRCTSQTRSFLLMKKLNS